MPPEDQNCISVGRAKLTTHVDAWFIEVGRGAAIALQIPSSFHHHQCFSRPGVVGITHGQTDAVPCTSCPVSSFSTGTIIGFLEKGRQKILAWRLLFGGTGLILIVSYSYSILYARSLFSSKLFEPLQLVLTRAVRTWQVKSVSVVHRCV